MKRWDVDILDHPRPTKQQQMQKLRCIVDQHNQCKQE